MSNLASSSTLLAVLVVACGPIYPDPPRQQQQPAPQATSGPPGGGDPWSASQADPYAGPSQRNPYEGPSDPYAGGAQPGGRDPYAQPRPEPSPRSPNPYTDPRDPVARPRLDREPAVGPEPAPADPFSRPHPEPAAPAPPPAAAPPVGPAPPPEGVAGGALSADARALLAAHNRYRAQHCAGPLTWSPRLEAAARQWANSLRDQGCKFGHSGGKYGENLAGGTSGTLDGEAVTRMWYDEVKLYDFQRGGFSMDTGHFTQVVWRATTQLGCAKTSCRGMDIWVCEYDPPGNVDRGYRANVLPTSCKR